MLSKIIHAIIYTIAALMLVVTLGIIALALSISPEALQNYVEKSLSTNGRVVHVAGPVDLHIFPTISLSFEDFSISQTDANNVQMPILTINETVAEIQLWPLLTGTAEFDNVTMTGLTIHPAQNAQMQKVIALSCNVAAHGHAHYDISQGFTADAIKRGVLSTSQVHITDIVLLDKQVIATLSNTFAGKHVEQFKSLSATINSKDGVFTSDNITLVGTDINATGTAMANLITNALDAAFDVNVTDFGTIPVAIKGTIQAPIYTVESDAAVNLLMKGLQGLGVTVPNAQGSGEPSSSNANKIDIQKALDSLGKLFKK